MRNVLLSILYSGLELGYGYVLFSAFFQHQRSREDRFSFLLLSLVVLSVYRVLALDAVSTILVRLLILLLMLTWLFRENGQRGLAVLIIGFGVAVGPEYLISSEFGMVLVKVIAIFAAWLTGRYLSGRVGQQDLQELEARMQRQRLEMQTESINALEQNYRLQRKITHEFEHHIQVLDDLLEAGALEEARAFVRQLRGSRSYRSIGVNSRHTIIDVILNQKYQTAQENDIRMQIQVNDLSRVTLPTDTLVVILSNLLDNAIEACRALEGYREIDCRVLYEEGLYLAIRNTSKPVEIREHSISTSKQDALNHGYGIQNICFLLDKMEAEYTFDYSDGWFYFAAEIPDS